MYMLVKNLRFLVKNYSLYSVSVFRGCHRTNVIMYNLPFERVRVLAAAAMSLFSVEIGALMCVVARIAIYN
jgi:hypothetical protein